MAEEHRSPPNNLEAEQALLVNNESIHLVANFREPEHFFQPIHGRIYDVVMHFVGRRETATPVTIKSYFENDEALKEVGGGQYLARLAGSAVTVINAGHYGRAVQDLHLRRSLIHLAEDMRDAAYDAPLDQSPREQVESVGSKLYRLLEDAPGTRLEFRSIGTAADVALASVEKAYQASGGFLGLPVAIRVVEKRLGGLQAPDLIVLGGRPGMGKTGMALGTALAAAEAGHAVLYASLEMSGRAAWHALALDPDRNLALLHAAGPNRTARLRCDLQGLKTARGHAAPPRRRRRPDARLHRAQRAPAEAPGPARPSDRRPSATHARAARDPNRRRVQQITAPCA